MKLSSIGYLVKEGFRNIKQNSFMSIASILVLISCLLLSGASYLIFMNVHYACDWADDQNVAIVWVTEGATEEQRTELETNLKALNNIQAVELIPKETTLDKFSQDIPDATFESLQGDNNPMLDAFKITFVEIGTAEQTIKAIDGKPSKTDPSESAPLPYVDSVSYSRELADVLTNLRDSIMRIGACIIVMLLFVSLFIISNTIKLTVYSRRLEIGIMKSVGATKAFIRLPFMVEGMVLGLAAGILSFGILYLVYTRLLTVAIGGIEFWSMGMDGLLISAIPVWAELLIGFLLIGTLTGMIGSGISISRYLKEESGVSVD